MSDPTRLIDQGADDYERRLLRANAVLVPPQRAIDRTLAAAGLGAGIGGAAMTAAGAVTTSSKIGAVALVKWGLVAAVAAGATWSAYKVHTHARSVASAPVDAPARAIVQIPADRAPTERLADTPSEAAAPSAEPLSSAAAPTIKRAGPAQAPAARSTAGSSLAAQIATIDGARAAIAAHEPARALHQLDSYNHDFAGGILGPEATVLRIEALAQLGRRAEATSLAARFLQAHPDSAHAAHIRSVVGMNR
jgi:hypothetical protein